MDGLERVLHEDPLLRSGASPMSTACVHDVAGNFQPEPVPIVLSTSLVKSQLSKPCFP